MGKHDYVYCLYEYLIILRGVLRASAKGGGVAAGKDFVEN